MISCIRTNSENADFINLVAELDAELSIRDGNEHSFYAPFNKISMIKHAVVAYDNNIPVGCGAIKEFSPVIMEVKRMFVPGNNRGKGIASMVLAELENWAKEMNCKSCVLETGKKQPEAIALYTKNGYTLISNFGQYKGVENSVCFEKTLLS